MTFKELKFRDISSTHGEDAKQAWEEFENGYEVSIIKHKGSYGNKEGLYEIGVFKGERMADPLGWGDDVKGYLSPEDVEAELKLIKKLKKELTHEQN
jgi:hypothetical protein